MDALAPCAPPPIRWSRAGSVCRNLRAGQFFLASACTLIHSTVASGQVDKTSAPLSIEDAVGVSTIVPPISVSPDGEWVAYTLQNPRRRRPPGEDRRLVFSETGAPQTVTACDVWIIHTKTGESINLGVDTATSWSPVWSPDGELLAFYSDRGGQIGLWIWERESQRLRPVPNVVPRPLFSWDVVEWLPDGRRVVLKIQALQPSGNQGAHGSRLQPGAHQEYRPDDQTRPSVLLYGGPADTLGSATIQAQAAAPWIDEAYADIGVADVRTGRLDRLLGSVRSKGYALSPNGSHLAISVYAGRKSGTLRHELFDLMIVSTSDGSRQGIAPRIPQGFMGQSLSWSPDSRILAFVTSGPFGVADSTFGELLLLRIGASVPERPIRRNHVSFADDNDGRPPLWLPTGEGLLVTGADTLWQVTLRTGTMHLVASLPHTAILGVLTAARGRRLLTSPGRRSVYVRTRNRRSQRAATYEIGLDTGRKVHVSTDDVYYGSQIQLSTDASADGSVIAYTTQSASRSEDIWVSRIGHESARRLTTVNPVLNRYQFSRSRLVSWLSADGERVHGALLLPAEYRRGERYPLVVRVYGGLRYSDLLNRFSVAGDGVDNAHLFTTRGYAVLLPDAPYRNGSTLMRDLAASIIPGVTRVIEMGVADPTRIGVIGHSFGGYTTLALLVQSRIFRAAVASATTGNLVATFGALDPSTSSWVEEGQLGMNGTPWSARERYIENSPIFYLDRVEAPLLLVSGSLDGLPPHLAEEVYVGLKRLGKPVAYAKYVGEEHYQGEWSFVNKIDYVHRLLGWFDAHLQSPGTNH